MLETMKPRAPVPVGAAILPVCMTICMSVLVAVPLAAPDLPDPAKIVDLTHTVTEKTPFWPGAGYHPFRSETIATLEADGVYSKRFCLPEHLGTHVDAPNHFEAGQPPLDAIPIEDLIAPIVVIDISAAAERDPDTVLRMADVRAWERTHGPVPPDVIVLLHTGWGRRAADIDAYRNQDDEGTMHFPSYSVEAARYLVVERDAKALGIDTLSIDPGTSKDFPVHHVVNGAGRYGLENVANLDRLPPTGAALIVAPMKIGGGSGGPVRLFGVLP